MPNPLRKTDLFTKNIIIVFAGTSLGNFFNLIYQLLIAHKLSPSDFAAFNSLLSVFMVIASPLNTISMMVAKYVSDFNARHQISRISFLLSGLLKKTILLAGASLLIFWFASALIVDMLKIPSASSGYILALLVASNWIIPVFSGGIQGLEFFSCFTCSSILGSVLKVALAFALILAGYGISGALGALLSANLIAAALYYFPLRRFINFNSEKESVNYKEMLFYLFPVAASYFCFISLVSFDMVLVKYYFLPEASGVYSLAQMTGKIFLFLPGAISIVMFPRASWLNARNMETSSTLKRSLIYVSGLSILAALTYNLFPSVFLKLLTGKAYPEAVFLGRLFAVSMSFFSLVFVLITYFLSIKKLHFLRYLSISCFLQTLAILLFHKSLACVQLILCLNSALLLSILLILAFRRRQ